MKNLRIKLSALAVLAIVAIGVTFTSCQKDTQVKQNNISTNQHSNFSAANFSLFNSIFLSTHEIGLNKIDKTKATKLAIIDALGGAGAAGGGPFVALWGGFLASLGAEPYVRTPKPATNIALSGNIGDGFDPIGNYHNALLLQALNENISTEVVNGYLNQNCVDMLVSHNFYSGDAELIFSSNQTYLIGIIHSVNNIASSNTEFNIDSFQSSFNLTENEIHVINLINSTINQVDISDISSYLLGIQSIVNDDTGLQLAEKENLKVYISILNSSLHFWNLNS